MSENAAPARTQARLPDRAERADARRRAFAQANALERAFSRSAGLALWVVATLLVAVIAHVGSILALPSVAPDDAFLRLARLAPRASATPVAPAQPGRELAPFLDPASALAFCRYDLADGPLRVTARIEEEGFLSLSLRNRENASFYALTDRAATRGTISLLIVTAEQNSEIEAAELEDPSGDTLIVSPTREGYVLARALAPSPDRMNEAMDRLKGFSCALEPS